MPKDYVPQDALDYHEVELASIFIVLNMQRPVGEAIQPIPIAEIKSYLNLIYGNISKNLMYNYCIKIIHIDSLFREKMSELALEKINASKNK